MAQRDERLVVREDRLRVVDLRGCVDLDVVGVDRQPRGAGGEPGVRGVAPLHRGAGVVAAAGFRTASSTSAGSRPSSRGWLTNPMLSMSTISARDSNGWLVVPSLRQCRRSACRGAGAAASSAPSPSARGARRRRPTETRCAAGRGCSSTGVPADLGQPIGSAAEVLLQPAQVELGEVVLAVGAVVEGHVLGLEDHVDLGARRPRGRATSAASSRWPAVPRGSPSSGRAARRCRGAGRTRPTSRRRSRPAA